LFCHSLFKRLDGMPPFRPSKFASVLAQYNVTDFTHKKI
jgi:hypothetical protein